MWAEGRRFSGRPRRTVPHGEPLAGTPQMSGRLWVKVSRLPRPEVGPGTRASSGTPTRGRHRAFAWSLPPIPRKRCQRRSEIDPLSPGEFQGKRMTRQIGTLCRRRIRTLCRLGPPRNLGTHVAQTPTPVSRTQASTAYQPPGLPRQNSALLQVTVGFRRPCPGDFRPDSERRCRLTEAVAFRGMANGLRSVFPLVRARLAGTPDRIRTGATALRGQPPPPHHRRSEAV